MKRPDSLVLGQVFTSVRMLTTLLPWGVGLGELETGPQVHEAFSKVLVQWLGELRWYPTCAAGWLGITAIELL